MNFKQDPEMERWIVRKLDRQLLPLLGILYLFSYLDRVNIGNARLFGLEEAVHLSNGQYNIALASFFLAYCLFELPSNWMLVRLGPRTWIPLLMFLCQFGASMAGFVPGVLFYLTLFYKRSEHSFRMAIFLCFNILAGAFGGLLAAGISQLAGKWNLQGWQWIFILEAIPTLLLAILTWFIMTPSPMHAKFLTEEERIYATNRIIVDSDVVPTVEASWRQTRSALTDVRVYLICLGSMLLHLPSAGVVMFLPSLIADMGFKATTAQLLTVPPYMVAACIALLVPWWSDRLGIRGYFAIFIPMVSVVGFSLLAFAPWTWLRYLAVTFALCGMVPTSSILTSWLTNNCIGHAKRATALAMIISAGSLAGMAGTQVYRPDDAPRYRTFYI
ncbi:MAG: major facilitator superfamily domain-containing protein [Linnemannia elongata]|nr:MAG: major facilitator superfamily domain-containing protein [Linnemannia elongata]